MSRVNDGWEFVKVGKILQYKEDSLILIVEIIEDNTTDEIYRFKLRPIAGNLDFKDDFEVHASRIRGSFFYSGMAQFYENAEYVPLPIGRKWKFIWDEEKLNNSIFVWKDEDKELLK